MIHVADGEHHREAGEDAEIGSREVVEEKLRIPAHPELLTIEPSAPERRARAIGHPPREAEVILMAVRQEDAADPGDLRSRGREAGGEDVPGVLREGSRVDQGDGIAEDEIDVHRPHRKRGGEGDRPDEVRAYAHRS